jgi:hypothetical protein
MYLRKLRGARTVLAAAVAATALTTAASTAAADPSVPRPDSFPCIQHKPGQLEWFCPLTQNRVPVYAAPDSHAQQIGWLLSRGPTRNPRNFFFYQVHADLFELPGNRAVTNDWWGYTQADKAGRKTADGLGYVPEVYFKGGGPFVPDATLPTHDRPPVVNSNEGPIVLPG